MSGKLHTDPALPSGRCQLPEHEVLQLRGRDALEFFQRQCMNDLRELDAVGCWQWNGLLGPKGRLQVLLAALRVADDALWLILPDGDAAGLADRLRGVQFRSRLQIERLETSCTGVFGGAPWPLPRRTAMAVGGGWTLSFGSPGRERELRLQPTPAAPEAAGDAVAGADWWAENLRHGLPRLAGAQRDRYTPQMLGLQRLAAFSVKKGCYPGQEIVARTHFLGQSKRALVRLGAPRALLADERVRCGSNDSTVLDYAAGSGEHVGVAVLPLEATADACLLDDGAEAIRLPFLEGLGRRPE